MFDPSTLPMAMPGDPASAAETEVSISGIEVPNPSTTAPTTAMGRRIRVASATPPRTSPSPPPSSRAKARQHHHDIHAFPVFPAPAPSQPTLPA